MYYILTAIFYSANKSVSLAVNSNSYSLQCDKSVGLFLYIPVAIAYKSGESIGLFQHIPVATV